MGQSQATNAEGAADTVITNALIIDHWGIVKADIGIKDGRISGIGKAGNPDVQPDVDIIFGDGTEAIAGEGKIVTARSEEHTSELQSLMRISYAVFCLNKNKHNHRQKKVTHNTLICN